jgi:hypothetical protein
MKGKRSLGRAALVASIGVLVLAGAGAAWFGADDAMLTVKHAGTVADAVAAPAESEPPAVLVATINDEVLAAERSDATQRRPTLDEMLNASAEPAPGPTGNVLSDALEAPAAASSAPAPRKAANAALKERERRKLRAAQKAQAPDSDVALLAALLAHSQESTAAAASTLRRLKQCDKLSASKAEQCRLRVCDGSQGPACDASTRVAPTP